MIEPPSRKAILIVGTILFVLAMIGALLAPPRKADSAPRPAPLSETRTHDAR